jgi:hypothetical protein
MYGGCGVQMKLRWFKEMLETIEDYKKHKGDLK